MVAGGLQICWERGWFVENGSRQHGLVAFCSKPWKLEAIFEMWKEPCIEGPGCLGDGNGQTSVQKMWVIEQMDCGRAGLIQDDAEAGMQAGESLVDLMAPMTFKVTLMAASWLALMEASMVAPMASMASMVASMASLASMVETLDWLKRMTAESRSDGERADGWTHKIREGRADGLTHKIREELTVGWILFVDVVQVVTWARTKRGASLVGSVALMAWIASTLALMVTLMMATIEASVASSRRKGDRVGLKEKCQNERRCHGSTMVLMVTSMASRVASMASISSMASMVASRALVVAVMASMASMTVPLEWLNLMVAEPKRDDERAGGLTLGYEGVLTVALEMASVVTAWMAPMTPLMTSMAPIASLASMVASMDLLVVLLASMASMVASLVWLRLMTEPKTDGKRDDGLIQKICE